MRQDKSVFRHTPTTSRPPYTAPETIDLTSTPETQCSRTGGLDVVISPYHFCPLALADEVLHTKLFTQCLLVLDLIPVMLSHVPNRLPPRPSREGLQYRPSSGKGKNKRPSGLFRFQSVPVDPLEASRHDDSGGETPRWRDRLPGPQRDLPPREGKFGPSGGKTAPRRVCTGVIALTVTVVIVTNIDFVCICCSVLNRFRRSTNDDKSSKSSNIHIISGTYINSIEKELHTPRKSTGNN